ncbi:MAG TPA: aminopeptidase P family N-terminal domain-containing protein, partial [bacterium]|nr:aminopeptidase P family N-terminal domain-containing protein [bacterium]
MKEKISEIERTIFKRAEKVKEFIENKKFDCIFTKNPSHIFYLTGLFDIEGYLLIDRDNIYIFTSPLYFYESLDNLGYNNKYLKTYIKQIKNKNFQKFLSVYKKIGFINTEISYTLFKNLQKEIKSKLIPINDFFIEIRMAKDEEEIRLIKKAKEITEKTLQYIENIIKEGITELDLVAEIKYQLIKNGARKEAF